MFMLRADALNLKDSHVVYGETKSEVIARMFTYLQQHHPQLIGQPTVENLARIDELLNKHIVEIPE
jgi:hypothetical protein